MEAPSPRRAVRTRRGHVAFGLAIASALASGQVLLLWWRYFERSADLSGTLLTLAAMVSITMFMVLALTLPFALVAVANRFHVPAFSELTADRRPPVVYLRPFEEDSPRTTDVISTGESSVTLVDESDDHLQLLHEIGPLVAIARPGRLARWGLHPLGPYRHEPDSGRWQEDVAELLSRARLVVLVVGTTPGIEWEIQACRASVRPESLLLYLPARATSALRQSTVIEKERKRYEELKAVIEAQLPCRLPEFREPVYVVGFTPDWEPIVEGHRATGSSRWLEHSRITVEVRRQLERVLARILPDVPREARVLAGSSERILRNWVCVICFALGLTPLLLSLR